MGIQSIINSVNSFRLKYSLGWDECFLFLVAVVFFSEIIIYFADGILSRFSIGYVALLASSAWAIFSLLMGRYESKNISGLEVFFFNFSLLPVYAFYLSRLFAWMGFAKLADFLFLHRWNIQSAAMVALVLLITFAMFFAIFLDESATKKRQLSFQSTEGAP